jgi:hypothetical protein
MNTTELVDALSRQPRRRGAWTPSMIIGAAALVSALIAAALAILWLKPRPDLGFPLIAANHVFLLKLGFTIAVVAATVPLLRDCSIPGKKVFSGIFLLAIPFTVIIVLGLGELALYPVSILLDASGHASRLDCLWKIPALSIPAFVAAAAGVRYLAPTNLPAAGAVVGMLAGAVGAAGYALHCHDDSIAFVAFAYTLAMAETALLGALLGPRILRWI